MSRRILIVEDDPDLQDLAAVIVRKAGYEVECAGSGAAAIAAFNSRTPDLVLLDIGLEDIDGFEVCRQIRARSATPVIFMTGREEEVDELIAFASGADDYVTKPFSERVLLARIASVLRRATAEPESAEKRLVVGPLVVDLGMHVATIDGKELDLTKLEFPCSPPSRSTPSRWSAARR